MAGGFILDYAAIYLTTPPNTVSFPMNKNLDDLWSQGKKINENDYVFVSGIFMDLVMLGAQMYTTDLLDFSNPQAPSMKPPNTPGLIDELLIHYKITPEGTREEKRDPFVMLEITVLILNKPKSPAPPKAIQ